MVINRSMHCVELSGCQGGMYLLTLMDWYAATFSVTVFALLELLVMTYIFGELLACHVTHNSGKHLYYYMK